MQIVRFALSTVLAALVSAVAPGRAQEADPFQAYSTPALGWQDEDDAMSYVARLRAASTSLGGTCEADRQKLAALADGLQIGADQAGTAGKPVALEWAASAADVDVPAWLVVS